MVYEKGTATLKYVRTDYEDAGLYTVEIDTGLGVIESSAKIEIAGMYACYLEFTPTLSLTNSIPKIFYHQPTPYPDNFDYLSTLPIPYKNIFTDLRVSFYSDKTLTVYPVYPSFQISGTYRSLLKTVLYMTLLQLN